MKSVNEFLQFADQYLNFEKTPKKNIFWLDTMNFLCERLGHPEKAYRCIHVAGSKGKGSVSMMTACILKEAGFRVGLYTSPHILDFAERIGSCDGPFSEQVYEKSCAEVMECIRSIPTKDLPGGRPLTWFELVTLYAMVCFRNAGVEYAVFEVGLGGRLDATNVISPELCIINQIEREHVEFLGDTVEKIAAEKGGIIKEGVPVFVSPQKDSVSGVFRRIASERNAPLFFVGDISTTTELVYDVIPASSTAIRNDSMSPFSMKFDIISDDFSRTLHISTPMAGGFQRTNASLAALGLKHILPDLKEETVEKGIAGASLPGRFEVRTGLKDFSGMEYLVLDGAHTPNSIAFTMDTLGKLSEGRFHLLFGCASDKDVEDMAEFFRGRFSHVTVTRPGEVKGSDLERMSRAFSGKGIPFEADPDYTSAVRSAMRKAGEEGASLLVTGSFYLVAEVKKILWS